MQFKVSQPAAPQPAAGQVYRTPAGALRLLVRTTDGKEAVVSLTNGRLLAHGPRASRAVFTTWAERMANDGYAYVGVLEQA